MSGIENLDRLLERMAPDLRETAYVFITLPEASYGDGTDLAPLGSFREPEGLTLIVPKFRADAAALAYEGTYRQITLQVHSSLAAVGLTAAVATALAERGISANVVAAYFHDHIFVPTEQAEAAMAALHDLQHRSKKG